MNRQPEAAVAAALVKNPELGLVQAFSVAVYGRIEFGPGITVESLDPGIVMMEIGRRRNISMQEVGELYPDVLGVWHRASAFG